MICRLTPPCLKVVQFTEKGRCPDSFTFVSWEYLGFFSKQKWQNHRNRSARMCLRTHHYMTFLGRLLCISLVLNLGTSSSFTCACDKVKMFANESSNQADKLDEREWKINKRLLYINTADALAAPGRFSHLLKYGSTVITQMPSSFWHGKVFAHASVFTDSWTRSLRGVVTHGKLGDLEPELQIACNRSRLIAGCHNCG